MSCRRAVPLVFPMVVVAGVGLGFYQAPKPGARQPAFPIGSPVKIKAPLGLPPVPIPADNPSSAETIALGRRLYSSDNLRHRRVRPHRK